MFIASGKVCKSLRYCKPTCILTAARSIETDPPTTTFLGITAPSAKMETVLPSKCDKPPTEFLANAPFEIGTLRNATARTLSDRA